MKNRVERILDRKIYYELVKNGFTHYMLQHLTFNEEQYAHEMIVIPFCSIEAVTEYRASIHRNCNYFIGEIEDLGEMADGVSGLIFIYREVGLYG